jgi:excisionase family DNA binding protein
MSKDDGPKRDAAATLAAWRKDQQRLTLTIPEAAKLLGVSQQNVRTAIRDEIIPSLQLGERRVVIPAHALFALLGITPGNGFK